MNNKLYIHLKKISARIAAAGRVNYEFHISGKLRDYYKFDQELYSLNGNVIFPNFYAVRVFADKMNKKRDLLNFPEKAIRAGQLNAMGLIDEILHYVVALYKQDRVKDVFRLASEHLGKTIGSAELETTLERFVKDFPPRAVYSGEISAEVYLQDESNRDMALEELLHLYLANDNPALEPFYELFDDSELGKLSAYRRIIAELDTFFQTQPTFGPENQNLFELLRTPARRFPHSLIDQLEFMRSNWGLILSKYLMKLFGGMDLIKEEEKPVFAGPGPALVADYSRLKELSAAEAEPERFSPDLHWMPKVVMIAKSTYVWLDQLSKKYKRDIYRLDQIPDEELDLLAERGFTALWLIGLWERSSASQKIKQIMGNPEAVSSAYSLYDYQIASDIGGEQACDDLRQRAWKRGIRLASDMVPNHTGIFSKWVIEHPDWFIQNSQPPFPNYSFNGSNLSPDGRVGIYIEDGYWNHSDAAVVFKRVDHHSGETRYIYHGNDGTSMPWNDTAQLNYLIPEVREAVIQTILHVARQFPVIRFDAAMTLAKRHFQRLWYPQPGSGGDIPSRAEHAMTREQFNHVFPLEFWREVVDRVAKEVPDTLLLAEAFWMMEGYFVRSLGMHRVYNSAFMNMFKNEENAKYRQSIKNVMDFNPEIMKRYVNFMNNPDEETAVAQFGKDDKYFGTCVVMCTLPGLPMFGHGQVEGFAEKYGMEYRKAYWNEQEDSYLVDRHRREIFPLLKKRYMFSEVQNFVLYDFISEHGGTNENVYAYSNRAGEERALVVYNNKFETATGYLRYSSATAEKDNGGFRKTQISAELNLSAGDDLFVIYRDATGGLEYIRHSRDLTDNGFRLQLGAFKYHVFTEFRVVADNEYHHYAELNHYLQGRGVPNIETAMKETFLQPVHYAFSEILNPGYLDYIQSIRSGKAGKEDNLNAVREFEQKTERLFREVEKYTRKKLPGTAAVKNGKAITESLLRNKYPGQKYPATIKKYIQNNQPPLPLLLGGLTTYLLGMLFSGENPGLHSLALLDELLLTRIIRENLPEETADRQITLMKAVCTNLNRLTDLYQDTAAALRDIFTETETARCLEINRYRDVLYFNKERFEEFLGTLFYIYILRIDAGTVKDEAKQYYKLLSRLTGYAGESGYRVTEMTQFKSQAEGKNIAGKSSK